MTTAPAVKAVQSSPCLSAALAYAARGWRVLALSPNSKVPLKDSLLQPNGSLSATTDPARIRELWTTYPQAGVGIATGKESGITVVDLDGPEAFPALAEARLFTPKTYVVGTRRGSHHYYAYDPDLRQGAGILEKLDVRNDGGYVVAPPTVIDGHTYVVRHDAPISEWPELSAYVAKLHAEKRVKPASVDHPSWVAELLTNGATEGQRNDSASRLAGYFRNLNIPKDVALASMLGFARACTPAMDETELKSVVDSVWRYSPKKALTFQGQTVAAPLVDESVPTRRLFNFPDQGVMVRAERISEHSDGLTCWLTVAQVSLGTIYGPISTNLMAPRSRKDLVNELNDRHSENWSAILQHVTAEIVASLASSGVSIDPATHVIDRSGVWLAHPYVRSKTPTLLQGDVGTGKTTIATAICLSLATGRSLVPGMTVAAPCNVGFWDWESDEDAFTATIQAIASGAGVKVPEGRIVYRRLSGPIETHLPALQRLRIEHELKVAIVDSVIACSNDDVSQAAAARSYYQTLRALDVASLGITHITKNGDDAKPYGSVFYAALSRNSFLLSRADPDDPENNVVGVYHKKLNMGIGRPQKPLGLAVDIQTDETGFPSAIRYTAADLADEPKLAGKLTDKDRIIVRLKRGLASNEDMAAHLAKTPEQTRALMHKKAWKGKLWTQVPPTMQWGLLTRQGG